MENIEVECHCGDNDPRELTYPIQTTSGCIATLGQAATRLCTDLRVQSLMWERAHEAIFEAERTGEDIDIRMATYLVELVCREAAALEM